MPRTATILWLLLSGLTAATACAQRAPELIVEIDRSEVYLGESLIYNVTVNHVDQPSQPVLDGFDRFDVQFVGQQSQNSQQISIINGRRSEVIRRGMLFQYRLTPNIAGTQTIPAPTAEVDGQLIAGREVTINVIAPEEQEIVFLDVAVDRESVYPLQEFSLTLSLAVRELPGQLAGRSPLSVQPRSPVSLTVPWLQDEALPPGVEPQQSWRDILEPLASGSSRRREVDGLQINGIGTQSAFSFFNESRKAVFSPPATQSTRTLKDGSSATFWNYEFRRSFKADAAGERVFAAAILKGTFGTEIKDEQLDGKDVYVVASPVSIRVNPVPLDNQPDTFIGGIGVFDVEADINPRAARVGDPMTLSLRIYGDGTVADIRPPDISAIEGIVDQFKLYDSTEATVDNGKVFTWSLRPLNETITEFPAIPVSYFDVQQESYVSKQSLPIPLSVASARQLATADIVVDVGTAQSVAGNAFEVNEGGLFANMSVPTRYATQTTPFRDWLALWIGMILVAVVANSVIALVFGRHADAGLTRRRTARSTALQRLDTATSKGDCVSSDKLSRVVTRLIADLTNQNEDGLTSADAAQIMSDAGVNEQLLAKAKAFFEECDAARFGAASADSEALAITCRTLIDRLSKEMLA